MTLIEEHGLDKYELDWLLELIDHAAPRTYAYDSVRYKLRKLRYGYCVKDKTMNRVYNVPCPKCGCVWKYDRPMPEGVICPVGYGCSKDA